MRVRLAMPRLARSWRGDEAPGCERDASDNAQMPRKPLCLRQAEIWAQPRRRQVCVRLHEPGTISPRPHTALCREAPEACIRTNGADVTVVRSLQWIFQLGLEAGAREPEPATPNAARDVLDLHLRT